MVTGKNKHLYIVAGPNGSGKTTFVRRFLPYYADCINFVNADLIATGLSPFLPDIAAIKAGKIMLDQISKRGRSLLRKILFYAAIQMIRKNGIMYDYYTRLTGKGMEKMRALIAVSRKLLRIIHAILRDNRDYVGGYQAPQRMVIKKAA